MKALIVILVAALGVFLICDGRSRSSSLMEQRELNPLELKRSPYGEIIGAALQEPVHLLSHGGIGHEHVEEVEDKAGCAGCGSCGTCDLESSSGLGHDADGHTHENVILEYSADKPWLARRKIHLARLEGKVRQNHNPLGRKAEARAYEKKRVWELMEMAYEMDPTNYANYMIYVDLESAQDGFEKILEISNNSLAHTEGKLNDPNDALTAAAAAEMLLIYRKIYADREGRENPELEADYALFLEKVEDFVTAFDKALAEGRLEQFTQEKVDEMITTYGRFNYTENAYGKYIDEQKLINVE